MGSHHRPAGALEITFNKTGMTRCRPRSSRSCATPRSPRPPASSAWPMRAIRRTSMRSGSAASTCCAPATPCWPQLAAWDKVIAENSKEPFFAKVIASQKAWVRRVQPYLAVNNLSSVELGAAFQASSRLNIVGSVMIGRRWRLCLVLCAAGGQAGQSLAAELSFRSTATSSSMRSRCRAPSASPHGHRRRRQDRAGHVVQPRRRSACRRRRHHHRGDRRRRPSASCTSDRARGDTELLDTLAGVTNWKRHGDVVR